MTSFKSFVKPWRLTETETFSSFNCWRSTLTYNICQDTNLKPFFENDVTWTRRSVSANRGLAATTSPAVSAAARCEFLEQVLGLVSQYIPHFLQNEVITNSTSMRMVWTIIREYYGFRQSESTFCKFVSIRQEPDERPERFYYRLLSHIQDNLLTTDSNLLHDGAKCQTDEVMTPTLERLTVLHWLNGLHPGLVAHIQRVFAFDLQRMTLKDLFPQVCEAMDALLEELRQNDVSANTVFGNRNYNRSNYHRPYNRDNQRAAADRPYDNSNETSRPVHTCWKCKCEGRAFTHSMVNCNFMTHLEKQDIFISFCESEACVNENFKERE